MKPKQAKFISGTTMTDSDGQTHKPVENAIEFGMNGRKFYWQILRTIIESLEEAHFKVSITKDGVEYNK